MSGKRYLSLYLDSAIADEFESYDSIAKQEQAVKKMINRKRIDLDAENEHLSESMLQFKSACLAHRLALRKVYEDESEKLCQLWEDMGDTSSKVDKHAKELASKFDNMKRQAHFMRDEIRLLKKEFEDLHVYGATQVVNFAENLRTMDSATKEILKTLLNK